MNAIICDKCKAVQTGPGLDAAKSIKRTKYRNLKEANQHNDVWEWFHFCASCNTAFDQWLEKTK